MSANRALAASQRRRIISGNNTQPVGKPGPISSIGSSQVLSNRRDQGQQSGRLAGQHAAHAQQQHMQQQKSNQNDVTRLTVAQAITLITLRLGKLESSMMQLEMNDYGGEHDEDGNIKDNGVDADTISSIQLQLTKLEKDAKLSGVNADTTISKLHNLIKQTIQQSKQTAIELNTLKNTVAQLVDTCEIHTAQIDGLNRFGIDDGDDEVKADDADPGNPGAEEEAGEEGEAEDDDVGEEGGDTVEGSSEELFMEFSITADK